MKPLLRLAGACCLLLTACAAGPEPVRWGTDTCDQCRMVLEDHRFAAELVTPGRTYKFDGLDELGLYMSAHPGVGTPYVLDAESGNPVRADQAVLVKSKDLHGPMGGQVVAFASQDGAEHFVHTQRLHDVSWPRLADALLPTGGPHASH